MTATKEQPSRYLYVGKDDFSGSIHTIVSQNDQEVITWSLVSENPDQQGCSWKGTPAQFNHLFQRVDG